MIALTILLAVSVGISLGLLGGGGAILMVPLLTYVAGLECKHAIATSSCTGALRNGMPIEIQCCARNIWIGPRTLRPPAWRR